jgi:hypothetical protein
MLALRPSIAPHLRAWILHSRIPLRPWPARLRTILRKALPAIRPALPETLFEAPVHLLRKLLATLHPRLRPAIAALRRRARTILRSPIRRLRIASVVCTRPLRRALIKARPAIPVSTTLIRPTLFIRAEIPAPLRTPLPLALAARLTWLPRLSGPARLGIALLRAALLHHAPIELREKLITREPAIAPPIELLQHLRRILHLLCINYPIVIRIQHVEERRTPAHLARPSPALSLRALLTIKALAIGTPLKIRPWRAAITRRRQTLRRIRRLRSTFLRTKCRCRERQRDRGKEKRFQVHKVRGLGVVAANQRPMGSLLKTPPAIFVV